MDLPLEFGFENVEIEGTMKTPYILLDKDKGLIEIRGNSIPENTREFYWHFNRWLTEYCSQPAKHTKVNLALRYINSSSAVVITRMMQLIDTMIGMNTTIEINWYYEEEDQSMQEQGQLYQDTMRSKINMIAVDRI